MKLTYWAGLALVLGTTAFADNTDLFHCRMRAYGSAAERAPMFETQSVVGARRLPISIPGHPNFSAFQGNTTMSTKVPEMKINADVNLYYVIIIENDKDGHPKRAAGRYQVSGYLPATNGSMTMIQVFPIPDDPFSDSSWLPVLMSSDGPVLALPMTTSYVESPGAEGVLQASCWDAGDLNPLPSSSVECGIDVSPKSVKVGQPVTVTLHSQGADSATIDGEPVTVPSAQKTITPTTPGTFKVTGTVKSQGAGVVCGTTYDVFPATPTR